MYRSNPLERPETGARLLLQKKNQLNNSFPYRFSDRVGFTWPTQHLAYLNVHHKSKLRVVSQQNVDRKKKWAVKPMRAIKNVDLKIVKLFKHISQASRCKLPHEV